MCFLIYPFFPLTIHSWEPNQRYFLTYYKYLWFFFQRWKTGMKWTPKKQLELIFVKNSQELCDTRFVCLFVSKLTILKCDYVPFLVNSSEGWFHSRFWPQDCLRSLRWWRCLTRYRRSGWTIFRNWLRHCDVSQLPFALDTQLICSSILLCPWYQ